MSEPMPPPAVPPNAESFNFRVDRDLKAAFTEAAAADDRSAAQVLRQFMRIYVARRRHRNFVAEARRQARAAAAAALDPQSDEAAVMRELEGDFDAMNPGEGWR
jgi:uncharacterized membrane protein